MTFWEKVHLLQQSCADSGHFKAETIYPFHHQLSSLMLKIHIIQTDNAQEHMVSRSGVRAANQSGGGCSSKNDKNTHTHKTISVSISLLCNLGRIPGKAEKDTDKDYLLINWFWHMERRKADRESIFGKQSLTHHFNEVGISFEIVLQSMDDQVIFALCLAQNQHV